MTTTSNQARISAATEIWLLILAMAVTAAALTFLVVDLGPLPTPFRVPWPALIPLVFLGEVAIVSLRFRRDAHVFSMSELPLVAGLFFVSPVGLIAAQLIGNALALGIKRRQPAKKLIFNLSLLTLQSALAVVAFRTLLGAGEPLGSIGSIATLVAVGLGVIAANILINAAILISGGGLNRREQLNMLGLGAATAGMNASLGLVAVTVMWTRPGTLWAAAVPPVALYLAYRAYVAQLDEGKSMQALYEATRALLGSPQIETAMVAAVRHARMMFDAEQAEIRVFRTGARREAFRTAIGPGEETVVMERVHPDGLYSVWESEELRAHLLACDSNGHTTPGHTVSHRMMVPVDGPDGVCGLIMVSEPIAETRSFNRNDLRFLETLASHISISLENGRLEDSLAHVTKLKDDLRHQAMHDALTGLGNRALLWEAMASLSDGSGAGKAAILMLDLDDFKSINDTLGHQSGDQVLVEVAQRLLACCRPEDTIARLGGDEFAILLEKMSSPGNASIVANRIAESLEQPIMVDGQPVVARASMGIALVEGQVEPQELMRQADQAMYSAKSTAKGTLSVFSDQWGGTTLRRDLAHAVSREELVLHYQPIVDLDSGDITAVEALVRWNHPQRGLLAPDLFIPLAEETGLIVGLGRWMLNSACQQAGIWHRQSPGYKPSLSINFSPRGLLEPDLVEAVATALHSSGLDPCHLTIEITENVMMQSFTRVLDDLKELGVRIAMDDFGVGYSSLSYLDRLPIDIVKIDRTFVQSLSGSESSPLVQLIVQIGDVLGLETVAEGIETPEQLRLLRGLGCRSGQGYLFARPMEAAAIAELLSTNSPLERFVETG